MHVRVREAYERANVQPPFDVEESTQRSFFEATVNTPGGLKKMISQIWRVRAGGSSDYVLYQEQLFGKNMRGIEKTLTIYHGKYDLPIFTDLDPDTGRTVVDRHQEVYDIPYSAEKIKEILSLDQCHTKVLLNVDLGGISYSTRNLDDFINLPFDKLAAKVSGEAEEEEPFAGSSGSISRNGLVSYYRGGEDQQQP